MSSATDGVLGPRRLLSLLAALSVLAAGVAPTAAAQGPNGPWTFVEGLARTKPLTYASPDRGPAGMGRVGEPFGAYVTDLNLPATDGKMGIFSYGNGRDFGVAADPLLWLDPAKQQLPPGLGFDELGNVVGFPAAPFSGSLVVGVYFPPADFGSLRQIAQIDFNIAPGLDAECAAELGGGGAGAGNPFPPGMPTTPVPPPQTPTGNVPIGTTPPSGFGRSAAHRSAEPRRLDECDREMLGMPLVSAQRLKGGKVSITTNAVPAGWSLRVAGAKRASMLRNAGAGRTVLRVKPGKQVSMRRRSTVKLPSSIKVVRGFWSLRGEKPIAGYVKDVMPLMSKG